MPPARRRQLQPPPEGVPPEYLAAAGGILGAQAAGTEPEEPDSATRAALVAAILVAVARYHAVARRRRREAVEEALRARSRDEAEIESTLAHEDALEVIYAERQKARIREELAAIAALADPAVRARKVQALMRRERRTDRLRTEASASRASLAVERVELRKLSPSGAYWRLGPAVEHCAICLFMANRFWPWEVLEETHPQVHPQCACSLHGLGEAIASGWLAPGDVPEKLDALALARGVVLDEEAYEEFWLDASGVADVLAEAFAGFKGWDPNLHPRNNLGQFVEVIGLLKPKGQGGTWAVNLDPRTRVSRDPDGTWRLTSNNRIFKGFTSAADVAVVAADRSAKMSFPETIGGQKYKSFDSYLVSATNGESAGSDAWIAHPSFGGGGGTAAKTDIEGEVARLDAAIVAASAGDKYHQRIAPELEKRRKSLKAKLGGAPAPEPPSIPLAKSEEIGKEIADLPPSSTVVFSNPSTGKSVVVGKKPTGDVFYIDENSHEQPVAGVEGAKLKLVLGGFVESKPVVTFEVGGGPGKVSAADVKEKLDALPMVSGYDEKGWLRLYRENGTEVQIKRFYDGSYRAVEKGSVVKKKTTNTAGLAKWAEDQQLSFEKPAAPATPAASAPPSPVSSFGAKKWAAEIPAGKVYGFATGEGDPDVNVWKKSATEFSVKAVGSGPGTSKSFTGAADAGAYLHEIGVVSNKGEVDKASGLPVGEKPAVPPEFKKDLPDAGWGSLPTGGSLEAKLDAISSQASSIASGSELSSLSAYTGNSYKTINGQAREARGIGKASIENHIVNLDSLFEKAEPLDEDVVLWRGVTGKTAEAYRKAAVEGAVVGGIIRDNGYGSTSTREDFAKSWGAQLALKIRYPKGRKALWAKPVSSHSNESEVMLPRGVALRVLDVRPYGSGGKLLVCELASGGK